MSTSPPLVVADRYRLVAPLGQGGMGRVWRATDVVLHRDVAIKELVPPPGLTPEERQEMRERSLREARAIARLNNINVVRVFDVLRTDADPWIVMEYVPSRSLQDILAADGPFGPVRAAEIGLGVLGALRAAHRAGVVHRDVKPGNVLIGEDGRVVLTDFGLATVPGDPNVTRTGLVLGSPAYIAPERARDGTAGPGADLWSLGATLYAAVEGASPFARPSAIATLAALATENPPPARNAGPLKPVLNGLLRKDPAHRINAEEAERLLLRATGRRSKLAFPMSPTMRRPGVGRERPSATITPPVVPGSAPVVPGPRPPVTPGRPPVTPGRSSAVPPVTPGRSPVNQPGRSSVNPPVTPGRSPVTPPAAQGRPGAGQGGPAALPPTEGRPPIFAPGKASVGRVRPPAETPTRVDGPKPPALDATRIDGPKPPPLDATRIDAPHHGGTGSTPPSTPQTDSPAARRPALDATMRGTGAFGSITAAEVAAHRRRVAGQATPAGGAAVTPPAGAARPPGPAQRPPRAPEGEPTTRGPRGLARVPEAGRPPEVPEAGRPPEVPEAGRPPEVPEAKAATVAPGIAESAGPAGGEAVPRTRLPFGPRPDKSLQDGVKSGSAPGAAAPQAGPAGDAAAASQPGKREAPGDSAPSAGQAAATAESADDAAVSVGEAGSAGAPAEVAEKADASADVAGAEDAVEAAEGAVAPAETATTSGAAKSGSDLAEPDGEVNAPSDAVGDVESADQRPAEGADLADATAGSGEDARGVEPIVASDSPDQAALATGVAASAGEVAQAGDPADAGDPAGPVSADEGINGPVSAGEGAGGPVSAGGEAVVPAGVAAKSADEAAKSASATSVEEGSADAVAGDSKEAAAPVAAAPEKPDVAEGETLDKSGTSAHIAAGGAGVKAAGDEGKPATAARPATKPSRKKGRTRPPAKATRAAATSAAADKGGAAEAVDSEKAAEVATNAANQDIGAKEPENPVGGARSEGRPETVDQPAPEAPTKAASQAKAAEQTAMLGAGELPGKAGETKAADPNQTRVVPPAARRPPRRFQSAGSAAEHQAASPSETAPVSGVPGFGQSSRPAWQPMTVRAPSTGGRGLTVFGVTLTRRQTVIGFALLAAVLLAVVLLVPLAFGDDEGDPAADNGRKAGPGPVASAGAPAGSAPAAPAPATSAVQPPSSPAAAPTSAQPSSNGSVVLPKGWYMYKDGSGFSVPAPEGASIRHEGSEVYISKNNRLLIVDQTGEPQPDPVADWRAQEKVRRGGYRNYSLIKIAAADYYVKAADWEFTYTTSSGNPQHVVKRGFITTPGKQAYGLSWYVSPDEWDSSQKDLQLIYQGFKPKS